MRFAKIENNSTSNGPGIRTVLWCQGCSIHCKGCHNPETWDPYGGQLFSIIDAANIIETMKYEWITGLTISGGHPLEPYNIEICKELCYEIKSNYPDKTIWLYTGWLWEDIKDLEILKYVDVVVDGPYIEEQRNLFLPYSGSNNQRVIDVQKSLQSGKVELFKIGLFDNVVTK